MIIVLLSLDMTLFWFVRVVLGDEKTSRYNPHKPVKYHIQSIKHFITNLSCRWPFLIHIKHKTLFVQMTLFSILQWKGGNSCSLVRDLIFSQC